MIDIYIIGNRISKIRIWYGWLRSCQIRDIVGKCIEWSEGRFGHLEDEFYFKFEIHIRLDFDPVGETHREVRILEIDEIDRRLPLSLSDLSDLIPGSPLRNKRIDVAAGMETGFHSLGVGPVNRPLMKGLNLLARQAA